MSDFQAGVFRYQGSPNDSVRLAFATDLTLSNLVPELALGQSDQSQTRLFAFSTTVAPPVPGDLPPGVSVAPTRVGPGRWAVVADVPSTNLLVGFERYYPPAAVRAILGPRSATLTLSDSIYRGTSLMGASVANGVLATLRTGIKTLPTATQRANLSDVVVIARQGDTPPTTIDEAAPRMLGSTRIATEPRVAIYWESYGLMPGDTAAFAVEITPVKIERGTLNEAWRRLTRAGADSPVSIRWKETVTRSSVVGRSQNLDLSQLPPGEYSLAVELTVAGQKSVSRPRAFSIAPPR